MKKPWYTSKTLWLNTLAFAAFLIQFFTGFVVSPEWQASALAALNFLLRLITSKELTA